MMAVGSLAASGGALAGLPTNSVSMDIGESPEARSLQSTATRSNELSILSRADARKQSPNRPIGLRLLDSQRLVGLSDDVVGGFARFRGPYRVDESGRLDQPPEPGQNVQVGARVAAQNKEEQVAQLPP